MSRKAVDFTFDEYSEIIKAVAPCMDDYMYFYDISQDLYFISEKVRTVLCLVCTFSITILPRVQKP